MSLRPLDLANIIFPGAPAVNPCNPDLMALAQSRMDIQKDTYSSRLILMNLNTREIQQLGFNNTVPNYDHSPRWSPDGNSLAFCAVFKGRMSFGFMTCQGELHIPLPLIPMSKIMFESPGIKSPL